LKETNLNVGHTYSSEPNMMKRSFGQSLEIDEGEEAAKRIKTEDTASDVEEEGHTLVIEQSDMSGMHIITEEEGITMDEEHMVETDGTLSIDTTHQGNVIISADGTQIIQTQEILEEQVAGMENHLGNIEHVTIDGMTMAGVGEGQVEAITDVQAEGDEDLLQYQNIIVQHMDIEEPLTTLRKLLQTRLQCNLDEHEFYLQDSIQLDPYKNLVSQCVQGNGMVQINVEVKSAEPDKPRLNIVDILKPAEEIEMEPQPAPVPPPAPTTMSKKVVIPFPEEAENVTRWIVDQNFRKEQERLKIPFDPMLWNETHVKHWIQWAISEFSLDGVNINSFNFPGKQLCSMKHEVFQQIIPRDKGDMFWTHLELLRKCKFVAVIQQPTPHAITTITVSTSGNDRHALLQKSFKNMNRQRAIIMPGERGSPGNRTGNNGQIQLWQFLLELLTDKDCQEVIHWVGEDGEFKLNNPEMVAQLWGQRKNKPTMNYEKLSRALRYYYDGDMIAKVHGKRFVYKFVCDLRMLLGYSAAELNRLVRECTDRKLQKVRDEMRGPNILRRVVHS